MRKYLAERDNREVVTFKQWGRKGFSLFTVLKKIVRISVLSVSYFLLVPCISFANTESDTLKQVKMELDLDEIEVSASRAPSLFSQIARVLVVIDSKEIEQRTVSSVQELLRQVSAVDIRERGTGGIQADISIRGGTFDQTLILLNGVNITDPQTGHHNLNIPVELNQIERIEILNGPAARIYGPNAFSGAINIVTREFNKNEINISAGGGSFGTLNTNISAGLKSGKINNLISGGYSSSKGYIENTDYAVKNLFYTGNLIDGKKLFLQAGLTDKEFGANSFYSPLYPNQFEKTRTIFSSLKYEFPVKYHLTPVVYYRRHSDTFMLFRNNSPEWYENHNYHKTDTWGANINSWFVWSAGKTSLGTEFRSEKILSNNLGEDLKTEIKVWGEDAWFTKSKSRNSFSFFTEHSAYIQKWTFSAGIMGNVISDYLNKFKLMPGFDMSYQVLPEIKLVASWNSSMRMPTFTDLYYSGPVNTGNSELKPEESDMFESGIKLSSVLFLGHLVYFKMNGKNIIDWVKTEADEIWQSMNHTKIQGSGIDADLKISFSKNSKVRNSGSIQLSYLYNNQKKNESELISYYVLDYLKQKFVASLNQPFGKHWTADLSVVYQKREGTYTRFDADGSGTETGYSPFWLSNAKIMYHRNNIRIFVSANNIFDKSYFDIGNIIQPGRRINSGIVISFPSGK